MWYDSFVESRLTRMNGLIKCEYYKNWSGWKLLWIDPFHNKMFHLRVDWFSPADMRINPEASHQSQTQVHWGIYHSAAAPPAGDTWYVHVASKFISLNHTCMNSTHSSSIWRKTHEQVFSSVKYVINESDDMWHTLCLLCTDLYTLNITGLKLNPVWINTAATTSG